MCGLSANMVSLRTEVLRDQGRRYLVPDGRYFRRFRRSGGGTGGLVVLVCACVGFVVVGGLLSVEEGLGCWELESLLLLLLLVVFEEVPEELVGADDDVVGPVVVVVAVDDDGGGGGGVILEATTVATGCRIGYTRGRSMSSPSSTSSNDTKSLWSRSYTPLLLALELVLVVVVLLLLLLLLL